MIIYKFSNFFYLPPYHSRDNWWFKQHTIKPCTHTSLRKQSLQRRVFSASRRWDTQKHGIIYISMIKIFVCIITLAAPSVSPPVSETPVTTHTVYRRKATAYSCTGVQSYPVLVLFQSCSWPHQNQPSAWQRWDKQIHNNFCNKWSPRLRTGIISKLPLLLGMFLSSL